MEETATISLERLKNLELIEAAMEEKKTIYISSVQGSSYHSKTFHLLNEHETIIRLAEINAQLETKNNELSNEIWQLKSETRNKKGWFR